MVAPAVAAAWIGAGSSLLGGALSRGNNTAARYDANKWNRRQMAFAKDFARMGVRWKVEDAKKAGLHPLYALGGNLSPGGMSPAYVGGGESSDPMGSALANAGQDISRAVLAQATPEEKAMAHLQMLKLKSEIQGNEAQSNYWNAQAAKLRQTTPTPGVPLMPPAVGLVAPKPQDMLSALPGDTSTGAAAGQPFMDQSTATKWGTQLRYPRTDQPAEAFSEMGPIDKALLLAHNSAYFGDGWLRRFINEFFLGNAPKYRRMPTKSYPVRQRPAPEAVPLDAYFTVP